jgi:hypothetical protein
MTKHDDPKQIYKDKWVDDEQWSKCDSAAAFTQWVTDGGWGGIRDFESSTGVKFKQLKGKWFTVVHGRVFTETP